VTAAIDERDRTALTGRYRGQKTCEGKIIVHADGVRECDRED